MTNDFEGCKSAIQYGDSVLVERLSQRLNHTKYMALDQHLMATYGYAHIVSQEYHIYHLYIVSINIAQVSHPFPLFFFVISRVRSVPTCPRLPGAERRALAV